MRFTLAAVALLLLFAAPARADSLSLSDDDLWRSLNTPAFPKTTTVQEGVTVTPSGGGISVAAGNIGVTFVGDGPGGQLRVGTFPDAQDPSARQVDHPGLSVGALYQYT